MLKNFKRLKILLWLVLALAIVHPVAKTQERKTLRIARPFVDGELLVKSKGGSHKSFEQTGAPIVEEFAPIGWQRIKLADGETVEQAIDRYRALDGVEAVQPNYIYSVALDPNDASFDSLYGMANIHAPAAWNITTGSSAIVVAVLDTGVRYTHEDLAQNMWHNPGEIAGNGIDDDGNGFVDDFYGYDFINNDSDPNDDFGHGTHVTGTIGAVGNNSVGVTGVNWTVQLMALKTHDGVGNSTSATVVSAFQYVAMMKTRGVNIRVTNSSWSGPPEAPGYDQALKDAIDAAGDAGVLNVFAAGNSNLDIDSSPTYPASYDSPSIIAVAASAADDSRSPFSNYGALSVDLAAPGTSVFSTYKNSDSDYSTLSGTSMSSPHVAGAAALLAASNPLLDAQSLKATLLNTVDALPQWAGIVLAGGRLNVAAAIQNPTVCNYSLPSSSAFIPAEGGSASITVNSSTNCGWMLTGKPAWIGLTSSAAGSGNGTIDLIAATNTTGVARQAQMNVAGQSFTVVQDAGLGADCELDLTRDFKTLPGPGGSRTISIRTNSRCSWVATSNQNWLTISSVSAGTGNGSITVSALLNPGSRRKATITVNGVTITVKQKGT